jgi:thioredoxin reductase
MDTELHGVLMHLSRKGGIIEDSTRMIQNFPGFPDVSPRPVMNRIQNVAQFLPADER